jgi:hypothetical protein
VYNIIKLTKVGYLSLVNRSCYMVLFEQKEEVIHLVGNSMGDDFHDGEFACFVYICSCKDLHST